MAIRPKASMKMVDRGFDKLKRTAKTIREGQSYVKAGLIGDSKRNTREEGGKLTNVDIGIVHEFGAPEHGIPERSFIRSTFEKNREKYIWNLKGWLGQVYAQKMDVAQALGLIGAMMANDMKMTIRAGLAPPLKFSTVRADYEEHRAKAQSNVFGPLTAMQDAKAENKARRKPLIDTGQLINSLTWAVVLSGQKKKEGH